MKTHCKHGHARTPDNTLPSGGCRQCNIESARRSRYADIEKFRAQQRDYRARNPRKVQAWRLAQQYSMTIEQYDAMLAEQGGTCAVCHGPFSNSRFRAVVDHDHTTGKVRGILHDGCNTALGLIGESASVAAGLFKYIHTHRDQ